MGCNCGSGTRYEVVVTEHGREKVIGGSHKVKSTAETIARRYQGAKVREKTSR